MWTDVRRFYRKWVRSRESIDLELVAAQTDALRARHALVQALKAAASAKRELRESNAELQMANDTLTAMLTERRRRTA